jgi:hypothetical protein
MLLYKCGVEAKAEAGFTGITGGNSALLATSH